MNIKHKEKESNEVAEEKKIKNAVIDLLHNNEEATHEAISKATGISLFRTQKHSKSIESMLSKLKKTHAGPNFKN